MEVFKLFDVLPFSVFIYFFYIPPVWFLPLTCHFRIYLLLFLIFYSVYLFFPEQKFPSLVLLMHLTVFLASITKGYLGLIGWYLMRFCKFLGGIITFYIFWAAGFLTSWDEVGFGEGNFPLVDSSESSGPNKGDYNDGDVISPCLRNLDCGHQTQGPPSELALITTPSNDDPRSEFERPFLVEPVRRQKPDSQRVEKLLLKTLQRRGLFVQWDAPKHSHQGLPITDLSHQFPGISSTKISSLKALKKAPFPAPLLSPTPMATINPLVCPSEDPEDPEETTAAKTALSQDITTHISTNKPMANDALLMSKECVVEGNGGNDYIAVTETFIPSASIPSSYEASTGMEHVAQTPSSPFLPTASASPSDEASTGTEHLVQTSSSPFLPTTSVSSSDEVSADIEHVAQTSSLPFPPTTSVSSSGEVPTGIEHVAQMPSSPFLPTTLVSPSDEAFTGTEHIVQTSSLLFLPTTFVSSPDEASTGTEHAAQTSSSFLPTAAVADEVINAKEDLTVLKENLVRNENPSRDVACRGSGDFITCDGSFEGQVDVPEDRPYEIFFEEGVMMMDFGIAEWTHTQDDQRISHHKAKKAAHCKPVRITRECAKPGHHDRRINRVLRNRFEGSTRCDRSVTGVELRPEGEQEGMEIEMDDTLSGVPENITSMDWHSSAMQVITMPHQPTRDTTPPQTHHSQPTASGEEKTGDAGDLMDVVSDTVASQVKRRMMVDEYEIEPTLMIFRVGPGPDRRIANIGHSRCVQTSTWTNWADESPKASLDKAASPDEPLKRSKEHNVKVQDLELLGHENLNLLGMKLQRLHNANLSRGDKNLLEELDEKKRLREEKMAKMAEKDRKRDEAMAVERLAKGPEIRGLAALVAAKKGGARRR